MVIMKEGGNIREGIECDKKIAEAATSADNLLMTKDDHVISTNLIYHLSFKKAIPKQLFGFILLSQIRSLFVYI